MINNKTVPFETFLGYYPFTDGEDKGQVLRNIALAMAEVLSRWDILHVDFTDDLQCGVSDYYFGELENKGLFIEKIIAVTADGHCLTEDKEHCGMGCYTFSQDDICTSLRINPPPKKDCRGGLKVKAKLGINMLTICEIPECFFLKYGVHLSNYAIYKQELLRRGEKETTTRAQIGQLREDAVQYFEENEYNPLHGQCITIGDSNPVRFRSC